MRTDGIDGAVAGGPVLPRPRPTRAATDEIDFRSFPAEKREVLMLRAAKKYYELDRTMAEIAGELALTRWQVARLLREAREQGLVRIEIVPRSRRDPELESRLQRRFKLSEAIVVTLESDGTEAAEAALMDAVAQAAGQLLAALTPRPPLLGVSWGRTMAAVAHWLPRGWNDGAEVVMLNGSMNLRAPPKRTNNIAELFAMAGNGRATLLPVPAVVGRAETRLVLEEDPVIASVLGRGLAAPVVCFGLGDIGPDSVLVQSGSIAAPELDRLRQAGAVGDILGRFVDAEGAVVDAALDARTIGLSLAALRRKPVSIGIAAGSSKRAIVSAAMRGGLVNVLVTDERNARTVLEDADGETPARA